MWTASTIQITLKNTHLKAVFVRVFFFSTVRKKVVTISVYQTTPCHPPSSCSCKLNLAMHLAACQTPVVPVLLSSKNMSLDFLSCQYYNGARNKAAQMGLSQL